MMRVAARIALATSLALLSCEAPTRPPTVGGLALRVVSPGGITILDSGRILVRGPTNRDKSVSPGQTVTIDDLLPGSYTVTLEGFIGDDLAYFGQTSGVSVTAGQDTPASVTFTPFQAAPPVFPDTFWIGKQITVHIDAVTGAASYRVEWSQDPTFGSGLSSMPTSSTTVQITVANFAVYYIRVRAVDPFGVAGVPGTATRVRIVQSGPAKRLVFSGPPTTTQAGSVITPAVEVTVQDSLGNTATGFAGNVAIAIGANPGGDTLSGTKIVVPAFGIAAFSDLSIDSAGTGYTLTATAAGLTGVTSSTFTVTPIPADLLIAASPALTVTPVSVSQGGTVQLSSFAVVNQGPGASRGPIAVGFYLSTDVVITSADTRLGGVTMPELAPATMDTVTSQVLLIPLTTTPATYYIGALVDDSARTFETDEGNNFKSTPLTVVIGSWSATGFMLSARSDHTATLLPNGKVLIVGATASGAELYDPVRGQFSAAANILFDHSFGSTATLLQDGRVLIVGGNAPRSAELYNPVIDTFVASQGTVNADRKHHTATLLADGRVLLAGGQAQLPAGPQTHSFAEVYDPVTDSFTPTGNLNVDRSTHGAVRLLDNRILIVGGLQTTTPGFANSLASAEVYDPGAGTFAMVGAMRDARLCPSCAALLGNGQVLVLGHHPGLGAELFNPAIATFSPTGNMASLRAYASVTVLNDGRVLVAGGFQTGPSGATTLSSAEVYSPTSGLFGAAATMTSDRQQHTATLLPDGRVLVAGGFSWIVVANLNSAELFSIP